MKGKPFFRLLLILSPLLVGGVVAAVVGLRYDVSNFAGNLLGELAGLLIGAFITVVYVDVAVRAHEVRRAQDDAATELQVRVGALLLRLLQECVDDRKVRDLESRLQNLHFKHDVTAITDADKLLRKQGRLWRRADRIHPIIRDGIAVIRAEVMPRVFLNRAILVEFQNHLRQFEEQWDRFFAGTRLEGEGKIPKFVDRTSDFLRDLAAFATIPQVVAEDSTFVMAPLDDVQTDELFRQMFANNLQPYADAVVNLAATEEKEQVRAKLADLIAVDYEQFSAAPEQWSPLEGQFLPAVLDFMVTFQVTKEAESIAADERQAFVASRSSELRSELTEAISQRLAKPTEHDTPPSPRY